MTSDLKWAADQQIIRTACCQNDLRQLALPTDSYTSLPPPPTSGRNDEPKPNTADLRVDHHLWGDWAFIITSLFLTRNWRLAYGQLSLDIKQFPVYPRATTGAPKMSLLHWSQKHACIDHKTKAYPYCSHGWLWLVHNVQPAATNARSKPQQDCQQTKCYARADPASHHKLYSILLDV